jgi:hypothetical protein
VLEPITGIARAGYLTKKGVANLTEKAASKATEQGASAGWTDLVSSIEKGVIDKLGDTPKVRRALGEILSSINPRKLGAVEPQPGPNMPFYFNRPAAGIVDEVGKSANELLTGRRQILARQGTGILKLFKGTDINDKVSGIVRNELSKNLHKIAPETKLPDKLYSLYSKGGKLGGDVPHVAAKIAAGYVLSKALGPILGPILHDAVKRN